MANKKTDLKEDVKQLPVEDQKEQVLLTEAEFERKQRLKTKERINRVTRVFGMFTIVFLVYFALLDPLFELSFFGATFANDEFQTAWKLLAGGNGHWYVDYNVQINGADAGVAIYDDVLGWGPWMGQIGFTVLLIGVVILMIYFLTYTIVDIIGMVKQLIAAGRDMTRDISGNVKDTVGAEININSKRETPKSNNKKKSLFSGDDISPDEEMIPKEKKEKPVKKQGRRSEKQDEGFGDLTSEQLDALLSGTPMEEVIGNDSEEEKPLF